MLRAAVHPGFRTRLTAAFILVASVTSGALALGSYVIVKHYRERTFTDHATQAAELALLSTPREVTIDEFTALFNEYHRLGGFESVAIVGDVTFSSSSGLGAADVPPELRSDLPSGTTQEAEASVGGERYLVAAGSPRGSEARLYFFFRKQDLLESLRTLRNVLAGGWLGAAAIAAAAGGLVAKQTLRPVRDAAEAARTLAEGLVGTKLPASSGDEFAAWSESFDNMASALEQKIDELSRAAERERRFTANVAHDLRTPLTGMSSAAALLEDELPHMPASARRLTELVVADVRRLESLVLELLELARLDVGQETAVLEPLSVVDSLRAVLVSWDGGTPPVSIRDGEGVKVMADRARFKRVMANLLTNARRHGGASGIEVVVRPEDQEVALDVLDRGPGLSPTDLERVFDRFYKSDPSRSDHGAGLGLAIAWENARLQGGSLEAANRPGGGARFTFRLARAR